MVKIQFTTISGIDTASAYSALFRLDKLLDGAGPAAYIFHISFRAFYNSAPLELFQNDLFEQFGK